MLRKFLNIITVWSLFFSQVSFAVELKLDKDIEIKSQGVNSLETIVVLPKGSVVKIPDAYVAKHLKGQRQDDAAIINWLKSGGKLKKFTDDRDGKIRQDYYFPVEVVSTPNGVAQEGVKGEVAIRSLALADNLTLQTVADTELVQSSGSEKSPDCVDCNLKATENGEGIFKELMDSLTNIFNNIRNKTEDKIEDNSNTDSFVDNFNNTCGISFDKFVKELKHKAIKNGIPPEILLGIMTNESSGRCLGLHEDGTSVGLFGISKKYSEVTFKNLKDPLKNLDEAIRILLEKYKRVNNENPSSTIPVSSMTQDELSKWKLALSAYNGGEAYVKQSKEDLLNLKKRYKLKIDEDDWSTRKAFYFREYIENNTSAKFTNEKRFKRPADISVDNIVYVESILGNDFGINLAEQWYPELKKQITNTSEEDQADLDRKKREEERRKRIAQEEADRKAEQERLAKEKEQAEAKKKQLEDEAREREAQAKRDAEEAARKAREAKEAAEKAKRDAEEAAKKAKVDQTCYKLNFNKYLEIGENYNEASRKAVADCSSLPKERPPKPDSDNKPNYQDAFDNFNLTKEKEEKTKNAERQKLYDDYKKHQLDVLKKWQEEQEQKRIAEEERRKEAKIREENAELIRLNNSNPEEKLKVDNKFCSEVKYFRWLIVPAAPNFDCEATFRNTNDTYPIKCEVTFVSKYNKVNDTAERTFILYPGQRITKEVKLDKPWVDQGMGVRKSCEFLPKDYKKSSSTNYDSRGGRNK